MINEEPGFVPNQKEPTVPLTNDPKHLYLKKFEAEQYVKSLTGLEAGSYLIWRNCLCDKNSIILTVLTTNSKLSHFYINWDQNCFRLDSVTSPTVDGLINKLKRHEVPVADYEKNHNIQLRLTSEIPYKELYKIQEWFAHGICELTVSR